MRIKRHLNTLLASTVIFGSAAALAPSALAQEDTSDTSTEVEVVEDQEEETLKQDRIVITGSRIQRSDFTSASPVQIINSETSTLQGLVSAAEILQSSSVAAGSGQVNNTFTGFVVDGGPGIDTISLRGLGAQRSLVLLNGRRAPPAGVGGTVGPVDLNILPNTIIQRFEILKDGASSVYGSDAVAGVVNVITRENIEGLTLTVTQDITEQGGAEETLIGASWGKSFDRGSFNISAEYYDQAPLRMNDRENFACPQDFYFNDDGSRADLIDPRTGDFKCYNALEGYVQTFYSPNAPFGLAGGFYGSRVPDPNGVNYEGIPGYRFIPFQERSFDDPREGETTIISPRERVTVFASGEYRPSFFDTTEIYTEFLYNSRESSQDNFRQLFPWYHPDSELNPYGTDINFDFGPLFGFDPGIFVAPIDGFTARPIVLVPSNSKQDIEVMRGVLGAKGNFSGSFLNGWSWDAYGSYSKSEGSNTNTAIPEDRINAGTGTIQNGILLNPDGVCGASAPAGCVPLDLFNTGTLFDGAFSDAAQSYYFVDQTQETEYTQAIFEASMTGNLFSLPAGDVGTAVGVHIRRDEIDDVPGAVALAGNAWGSVNAVETRGDDTVKELFAEVELPILRNKPGFEDLTLNVSGRYSDYDSVGDATTYKVGLNWQIIPSLRLRASHGTSFRAPQLYELYLGNQTSFLGQINIDPCINYGGGGENNNVDPTIQANCAADGIPADFGGGTSSAEILTGGGLGLQPEDSKASTIGLVITPPELGLSVAIDYFSIEVEDQIASFAAGVVGACYADPDFRSQPGFCDLFTRELDPTAANFGTITNVDASYRNIPTEKTSGLDFTVAYEKEFDFGTLDIDASATWTENYETQLFVGSPFEEFNGLIGEPEWVGRVQSRFLKGDWTTTWTLNYTGEGSNLGYEGEDGISSAFYADGASYITSVDAFITHDLTVRKTWDKFSAVIGLRNVFDEEAPIISDGDDAGSARRLGNYPGSSQYIDGFIGRSLFLTLAKEF